MDYNTPDYIEITGANLVEVAKKAYELSSPQGMGFLHAREGGLSDEEAKQLVERGAQGNIKLHLDYVHGRAVKLFVLGNDDGHLYLERSWYDHSKGDLDALISAVKTASIQPA